MSVPAGATYEIRATAAKGAVWIAIDPFEVVGDAETRAALPGDTGTVPSGAKQEFRNVGRQAARLTIIEVKSAIQDLTVQVHNLTPGHALDEASESNDALIIAVTALKLREVWNLEKEDDWVPSKPIVFALDAGGVRWVAEGEHEFSNLLPVPIRFVTVEW